MRHRFLKPDLHHKDVLLKTFLALPLSQYWGWQGHGLQMNIVDSFLKSRSPKYFIFSQNIRKLSLIRLKKKRLDNQEIQLQEKIEQLLLRCQFHVVLYDLKQATSSILRKIEPFKSLHSFTLNEWFFLPLDFFVNEDFSIQRTLIINTP